MTYDPFVGKRHQTRIQAAAYRQIARDLAMQSANFHARARQADEQLDQQQDVKAQHKALRDAIEAERDRLANDPYAKPAEQFGISRTAVKRFYAQCLRQDRERDRIKRNAEILRLWKSGVKRDSIAARVKMHPKSIQKIIHRQLDDDRLD